MKASSSKHARNFEIGTIIEEIFSTQPNKRIGEIVAIFGEKTKKIQVLQLNPHDLTPFFKSSEDRLKFFTVKPENCKKLDLTRIRKPNSFLIGDVVRHSKNGRLRFGVIVGFTHPEGLYSHSIEKGYNGKDLIECVEISGRAGLPHKLDSYGHVKRFTIGPENTKVCEILPMDKNGGVRIKDYWDIKRAESS